MAGNRIQLTLAYSGGAGTAKPLDVMGITVHVSGTLAKTARVIVTDSEGRAYCSALIHLSKGEGHLRFSAGGVLGQHRIEVVVGKGRAIQHFTVQATTEITTDDSDYDYFFEKESAVMKRPHVHALDGAEVEYVGGKWLRDHVHILKGSKYWSKNIRSVVDYYLKNQGKNGAYADFFHQLPDGSPATLWRMDAEADLEYIMVEAVYVLWQVSGDDRWMFSTLKKLEKGLSYCFTDPQRWSVEHGLIKRPFTIDTWDFEYVAEGHDKGRDGCPWNWPSVEEIRQRVQDGRIIRLDEKRFALRPIDERTRFCIMHGDNSGLFKACRLLSAMHAHKRDAEKSRHWKGKAKAIRSRTNEVCWNGKYYTHQVHIDPVTIPGGDVPRLSLSNTYDMNRGLPSHEQAVSIIREYQKRAKRSGSFAEWFSIDPPYPSGMFRDGGKNSDGVYVEGAYGNAFEYINGTVMPLVAGELAKACFDHGYEKYGADIILRMAHLLKKHGGKEYFMYRRDGSPWFLHGKTDEGGPSPWGTAALLYAYIEGLAGIEDRSTLYQHVSVSPRWAASRPRAVAVTAKYGPNDAYFSYRYTLDRKRSQIRIQSTGSGRRATYHILMPAGNAAREVEVNGKKIAFKRSKIEKSCYADFTLPISVNEICISW